MRSECVVHQDPRGPAGARRPPLWTLATLVFISVLHETSCADNLALLSGTLRTYNRGGCDDHTVSLHCPPGTSISVQQARYGRTPPHVALCGQLQGRAPPPPPPQQQQQQQQPEPPAELANQVIPDNTTSCLWSDQLQYSLLQTVVEACQKKRLCQFQTSPRTFGNDPCPGVRKWVEVAYKCRPYEFRSKVACEKDVVQLQCNPNARIAVYSASYGRTEYESIQCPQPQRVPEETCLTSYATETVMNICHGKRSCTIAADKDTFGSPCRPESRMYLKVVYTCVPRKVLKEEYEGRPEPDENPDDADTDYEGFDNTDEYRGGAGGLASFSPAPKLLGEPPADNRSAPVLLSPGTRATPSAKAVADSGSLRPARPARPAKQSHPPRPPPAPAPPPNRPPQDLQRDDERGLRGLRGHEERKLQDLQELQDLQNLQGLQEDDLTQINCTVTILTAEKTRVIGIISDWINTYSFMKQNQEKLYLYLTLSITGGLLLFLGLVIGRLLVQRHRARSEAKFRAANAVPDRIANGFADDISEIDADIDLTTPVAVPVVAIHSPPRHEPAEVVRYGGTLRRGVHGGGADMEPRSLNRGGGPNQQFYYG